jgi:hypothetical protein
MVAGILELLWNTASAHAPVVPGLLLLLLLLLLQARLQEDPGCLDAARLADIQGGWWGLGQHRGLVRM